MPRAPGRTRAPGVPLSGSPVRPRGDARDSTAPDGALRRGDRRDAVDAASGHQQRDAAGDARAAVAQRGQHAAGAADPAERDVVVISGEALEHVARWYREAKIPDTSPPTHRGRRG